jgi:hypothetical protein
MYNNLAGADLSGAHFIKTKLGGANLTGACVYGVSCWDVEISDATDQRDLVVTGGKEAKICVDDIRVAQFIHLLLTHRGLRTIIQTVGEKAVLLLGRFGGGGLEVLQSLGGGLRAHGYIPVVFEFARLQDRTYTETVQTLAGLARFVVVDLSGPSVPQELYATVPHLKLPFVPILEKGKQAYSMFSDLLEYDWVLKPIVEFESARDLLRELAEKIIKPAEQRVGMRRATLKDIFA